MRVFKKPALFQDGIMCFTRLHVQIGSILMFYGPNKIRHSLLRHHEFMTETQLW